VGEFPYQAHINIIPFAICFEQPEPNRKVVWDNHGIYKLENGIYVSPNPEIPSVLPADIPGEIPITPLVEVLDSDDTLTWPADTSRGLPTMSATMGTSPARLIPMTGPIHHTSFRQWRGSPKRCLSMPLGTG
jgi:hypothetical protein